MKNLTVLLSFVGVTLAAGQARAEFGNEGDVSFGADRLSGFYVQGRGGADWNTLGLGSDAPGGWSNTYSMARLGVDFIIVDHLSLGGNLAIWTWGGDRGFDDDGDVGFLIYPRVGYVIAFDDTWGFWPRGGLTFRNGVFDDDEIALTLEATFFAAVVENFGFTFGPTFDIGIAGDGPETRSFGIITGGLFGWL